MKSSVHEQGLCKYVGIGTESVLYAFLVSF